MLTLLYYELYVAVLYHSIHFASTTPLKMLPPSSVATFEN
jgi:hypothetical protein